ncbi:eCIS core domain-containing protein [Tenacibaculum agarivorans]|uniref:eCIS core domain-containing protein n=1 Tax=Tenacibaculum agarivorans TaxID=1908389 RepID=UPI0009F96C03|nr:DUF4157 domain-containing protein [Tenacibaculum agarivorans]
MSSYTPKFEQKKLSANDQSKNNQAFQLKNNRETSLKYNDSQNTVDTSAKVIQQKEKTETITNAPVQRVENKTGLPDQLKSGIESLSGMDMSDTRVHYNSSAPAQLQAHAFAQGNNIHVAPGQEQHLPHEAWHVVQQKQERVKATKQLKGKTAINDDAGLEREADVMGTKAMQVGTSEKISTVQKKSISSSSQPIQRYAAKKDQRSNHIYNVSQNNSFVVGIEYPNHELYIRDTSILASLNERVKKGLLKFVASEEATSFNFGDNDVDYYRVAPEFSLENKMVPINEVEKQSVQRLYPNLAEQQDQDDDTIKDKVYRGIKQDHIDGIRLPEDSNSGDAAVLEKYTTNVDDANNMYKLRLLVETIRKAMVQMDYKEDGDVSELKGKFVTAHLRIMEYLDEEKVNDYLERYNLHKFGNASYKGTGMKQKAINEYMARKPQVNKTDVLSVFNEFKNSIPEDSDLLLMEMVQTKANEITQLLTSLPNLGSKRQVKVGHFNSQLESIRQQEAMLVRGCDYTAASIMGKLQEDDIEDTFTMLFQLTNLSTGHQHYSTKLIADSTDFVTMEGFAGGYQNFDNTWEFFLHGGDETEVDSFQKYTESRYDFFPDTKIELDAIHGDNPDNFRITTKKKLELDNVDRNTAAFTNVLRKGGGGKAHKFYTRSQQERDAYDVVKLELYNTGYHKLTDEMPEIDDSIPQVGYGALEQQSALNLLQSVDRGKAILSQTYKQELNILINTKISFYAAYLDIFEQSKDYLKDSIDAGSITFDQKVNDLISACDTKITNNSGKLFSYTTATSKKRELQGLQRKVLELRQYKLNHYHIIDNVVL